MYAADNLSAVRLEISGMAAALHLAATHGSLELCAPGGELLLLATAYRMEPAGVRGAVDDGRVATFAKSRRFPGPVRLTQDISRLVSPLDRAQENL